MNKKTFISSTKGDNGKKLLQNSHVHLLPIIIIAICAIFGFAVSIPAFAYNIINKNQNDSDIFEIVSQPKTTVLESSEFTETEPQSYPINMKYNVDWPQDETRTVTVTSSGDNNQDGSFEIKTPTLEFSNETQTQQAQIVYKKPGNYTFLVKQVVTEGSSGYGTESIAYDHRTYTINVEVTQSGEDQPYTLTAQVPVYKIAKVEKNDITFNNNLYYSGSSDALSIDTVLEGRPQNNWISGDQFSYTCTPYNDAATGLVTGESKKGTVTFYWQNGNSASNKGQRLLLSCVLRTLTPTTEPVIFQIKQNLPQEATEENGYTYKGIKYDNEPKYFTFNLAKASDEGHVSVDLRPCTSTGEELPDTKNLITFKNTYSATGTANIEIHKSMVGRSFAETDKFSFKMVPDTAKNSALGLDEVPMPSDARENTLTKEILFADDIGKTTADPKEFASISFIQDSEHNVSGKTYAYTITEEPLAEENGVIISELKHTAYITPVDNGDGTITCRVSVNGSPDVDFANAYKTAPVVIDGTNPDDPNIDYITIQNKLTGRDWTDTDAFKFIMEPAADNPTIPDPEQGNGSVIPACVISGATMEITKEGSTPIEDDTNSTYEETFGQLNFMAEGTYKFTVKAVLPEGQDTYKGITYDKTEYTLELEVKDDGKGKLQIESCDTKKNGEPNDKKEMSFENVYVASPASLSDSELMINAKLNGRPWAASDTFKFTVTTTSQEPEWPQGMNTGQDGVVILGSVSAHSTSLLSNNIITFTKPGTYTYTVEETASDIAGITVDNTKRDGTIIVSDNGEGQLRITTKTLKKQGTEEPDGWSFTNEYKSQGSASLSVVLKMDGRDINQEHDKYNFVLSCQGTADKPNCPMPKEAFWNPDMSLWVYKNELTFTPGAQDNKTSEAVEFTTIPFTQDDLTKVNEAETFTYYLSEELSEVPGVTRDPSSATITVSATDDTASASIKTTVDCGEKAASGKDNTLEFTNTYSANGSLDYGSITVEKKIEGRELIDTDNFNFEMKFAEKSETDGASLPEPATATVVGKEPTASFNLIPFTEVGEWSFTVSEVVPDSDLKGIAYSDQKYTFKVKTVDSNYDGTLEVTLEEGITADPDMEEGLPQVAGGKVKLPFTNSYEAAPAPVSIPFKTVLNGRNINSAYGDSFTYKLSSTDEEGNVEIGEGADTISVTGSGTSNESDDEFTNITIKKTGEYTFTITEQPLPIESTWLKIDDKTTRTVHVNVTDPGTGVLAYEITSVEGGEEADNEAKSIIFHNTYIASGKLAIPITKKIEGRDIRTSSDEFNFTISADTGGAPLPEGEESSYTKTLKANAAELTSNTQLDKENFFEIDFTAGELGPYTYTISETEPPKNIKNITIDQNTVTANVTLADDGKGTLTPSASYTGGTEEGKVSFTNVYEIQGNLAADTVKIDKKLSGREWVDSDSFDFEINCTSDNAQYVKNMPLTLTMNSQTPEKGEDTATRVLSVPAITFTKAGDYTFEVREKAESAQPGINYAENTGTFNVKVEVANPGTGEETLTAVLDTEQYQDGTAEFSFENTYVPTPATLPIIIEKTIVGRNILDTDTFKFTLSTEEDTSANGIELPAETTITLAGDNETNTANTSFGDITFSKPGTFIFSVSEDQDGNNENGLVYDANKKFTVTVSVEDDPTVGALSAVITKIADESGEDTQAVDKCSFTNTYTAQPAVLIGAEKLVVEKVLNGREWKEDDSFTFTLSASGENIESVVLPEQTTLTITQESLSGDTYKGNFENVTFNKAGEYTLQIAETPSDPSTKITNDPDITRTFNVNVSDNLKGNLIVEDSEIVPFVFTNTYTPDALILDGADNLCVAAAIDGRAYLAKDAFTVELSNTSEKETGIVFESPQTLTITKENTRLESSEYETRMNNFGNITFTEPGTYSFEVSQTQSAVANLELDKTPHELVFNVVDNDGVLELDQESSTTATKEEPIIFMNAFSAPEMTQIVIANKIINKVPTEQSSFVYNIELVNPYIEEGIYTTFETAISSDLNTEGTLTTQTSPQFSVEIPQNYVAVIKGVPDGTIVNVIQETQKEYNLAISGAEETSNNKASITAGIGEVPQQITFENTYKTGSVSLTKKLSGNALTSAQKNAKYTFTMVLTGTNGKSVSGSYSYNTKSGIMGNIRSGQTVNVTADDTLTIELLPAGATVKFTESTDSQKGFTSVSNKGVVQTTVKENTTGNLSVTNTNNETIYKINVKSSSGGLVTSSTASSASGKTVTLTVKPNKNYKLSTLTVKTVKGATVKTTNKSQMTYTFIMPSDDVNVTSKFVSSANTNWTDVTRNSWYYSAVTWAGQNGLLTGYANTTLFGPNDRLTRGQAALILWRWYEPDAANSYVAEKGRNQTPFADNLNGQYYTGAMNWAYKQGIFTGYEGTNLVGTMDSLTRQQMCTVIYRCAIKFNHASTNYNPAKFNTYPDRADVAQYGKAPMGWCVDKGVINGWDNKYLAPQMTIDRAQMSQLMMNAVTKNII